MNRWEQDQQLLALKGAFIRGLEWGLKHPELAGADAEVLDSQFLLLLEQLAKEHHKGAGYGLKVDPEKCH
jgi:hypothetical protein